MSCFLRILKPYSTTILFIIPAIFYYLIPVLELFLRKPSALTGVAFSIYFIVLLPVGALPDPLAIFFPFIMIASGLSLAYFQRQLPRFKSFWFSLLGLFLLYLILIALGLAVGK